MYSLERLNAAEQSGIIPGSIASRVRSRMRYVESGVRRVEKAASLRYPQIYLEPYLSVVSSPTEMSQMGVIYARTLPISSADGTLLAVELSAALVLLAERSTIHAVLAHELAHYFHLAKRIANFQILSHSPTCTVFELMHEDQGNLQEYSELFSDRYLVHLMKRKFSTGLNDPKLDGKVAKLWIEKALPTRRAEVADNYVAIPLGLLLNLHLDPLLSSRLQSGAPKTVY